MTIKDITGLYDADKYFESKGATHYHDVVVISYAWSLIPSKTHMFRHYFINEYEEIGYVTPLFFGCEGLSNGVVEFDKPRTWGIPHDMTPIR